MAKYLISIVETEEPYADSDETLFNKIMEMHNDFTKALGDAGAKILGGEALRPVSTATFIRNTRSSKVIVVDNPLPDVKEILGGYYLIEVEEEAQAVELAKLCPAPYGYVEVRPVWEFD